LFRLKCILCQPGPKLTIRRFCQAGNKRGISQPEYRNFNWFTFLVTNNVTSQQKYLTICQEKKPKHFHYGLNTSKPFKINILPAQSKYIWYFARNMQNSIIKCQIAIVFIFCQPDKINRWRADFLRIGSDVYSYVYSICEICAIGRLISPFLHLLTCTFVFFLILNPNIRYNFVAVVAFPKLTSKLFT